MGFLGLGAAMLTGFYSNELLSTRYTTHQFANLIYYSYQDKFQNQRIKKICRVHQKLQAKHF